MLVAIGNCQPCQERAATPCGLQRQREQSGGDLLAGGDHRVVFAGVVQRRGGAAPVDQLIGRAGHGGDHDGDLVAGVDLALDVARHVADAVDVGDRRSAELHHQPGHDTRHILREQKGPRGGLAKHRPKIAAIHTGRVRMPQPAGPVNPAKADNGSKAAAQDHRRRRRGRALLGARRGMVGSARQDGAAAQVQSGAARLHPRPAPRRASAAIAKQLGCLKGLRFLDIGCGGGILSEPLARLGAAMVGADPSETNIEAAKLHAAQSGLAIDYRATTAEDLADAGERFDVVLAMEVVEHVADVNLFVESCAAMVKPGGLMIAATLNRTLKSFALAIVGAEYILRWLPVGTHQWDKFVTPNELEIAMEQGGLRVTDEQGVIYNLFARRVAALDRHRRELHADGGAAR